MTTQSAVRYHLRAHLPPDSHDAEVEAIMRIVDTGRIDEVTTFAPHEEEWSPGLGTDEENRAWVERVRPFFRQLRERGITPSVNVWWTNGFSDLFGESRDQRGLFDFRWAVSETGVESTCIACPWDECWRDHVCRMYAAFAELEPSVIWIDDDVRANLRANLRTPCFCDVCVERVGRQLGRSFTRESLVRAILADPPGEVRAVWLASLEEQIRTLDAALADAVHRVSPVTRVGLMVSPPNGHASEGRDWGRLFAAIGPEPWVRPTLGCYQNSIAPDITLGLNLVRQTQAVCPPDVTVAPEVENYPQSRFYKSVRLVEAQLELCQVFGIPEMTFSIYRFAGRLDLDHEPIWEQSLGRIKPRLELLRQLGATASQQRGVGLLFHEHEARYTRGRTSTGASQLQVQRPWDIALPLLGFATRYEPDTVNVLTAETAWCYSEDELRQLCSQGLLVDARAAAALIERGYGQWIGASAVLPSVPSAMEIIGDAGFGREGDLINLRYEGALWQFELLPGAREISWVRRLNGSRSGHGMVLWENALGGRVAICPIDSQLPQAIAGSTFVNWPRQDQLRAVFAWLGRGPVPLFIPEAPAVYPLLAVQDERLVIAVANLTYDPVPGLTLALPAGLRPTDRVCWLDRDNRWQHLDAGCSVADGTVTITTGLELACLDVAVLQVERA